MFILNGFCFISPRDSSPVREISRFAAFAGV